MTQFEKDCWEAFESDETASTFIAQYAHDPAMFEKLMELYLWHGMGRSLAKGNSDGTKG